jgi:hypothetical protein
MSVVWVLLCCTERNLLPKIVWQNKIRNWKHCSWLGLVNWQFLLKLKMKKIFNFGVWLGRALSTSSSCTLVITLVIVHMCICVTWFSLLYVCHCSHLQYWAAQQ